MRHGDFIFKPTEAMGEQYEVSLRGTVLGVTDVTDARGRDWFAVGQNLFATPIEAARELLRRHTLAQKQTTDTFGRVWESNAWFYTNKFFCIGCRQPIPTWYDEKQNRDKQICKHKKFKTADVIQMEGTPTEAELNSGFDYVDALAGTEIRSYFVSDGKADGVVGCYRNGNGLKLYCGGEVLTENATREQMIVLFDDLFRAEFGGMSVEQIMAEFV